MDLEIAPFTKMMHRVMQQRRCEINYDGVIEAQNKCITYSVLTEICIIANKTDSGGQWELAKDSLTGKFLGCSDTKFAIGKYQKIPHIKKNEIITKMKSLKVRVRSADDPAIQALLITEGTYVIGMDPKHKMNLSITGVVVSTALLCFISFLCCSSKGIYGENSNNSQTTSSGRRRQTTS